MDEIEKLEFWREDLDFEKSQEKWWLDLLERIEKEYQNKNFYRACSDSARYSFESYSVRTGSRPGIVAHDFSFPAARFQIWIEVSAVASPEEVLKAFKAYSRAEEIKKSEAKIEELSK